MKQVACVGTLVLLASWARADAPTGATEPAGTSVPRAAAPAEAPPRGPADLINRAREQARKRSLTDAPATRPGDVGSGPAPTPPTPEGAAPNAAASQAPKADAPAGHAPPDEPGAGAATAPGASDPHAGVATDAPDPHAGAVANAMNPHGMPRPISVEQDNPALPAGTLRVRVVDGDDRPVTGADVRIGILGSEGARTEKTARTDAEGHATFAELAVGERQAYRVTVPHQGARYGSMPFRLPPRGGIDVVVRRLPVTHDDAHVVLYLGATSIELKDERLSIVQQARLVNLDTHTYVFPEGGRLVRLPTGFTAFQVQDSMGDQRVRQSAGEGLRVEGSIPPGEATLLWGFDLPIHGSEMRFTLEVPWRAFAYRVIADAAPGLTLSVDPMPEPWLHEDGGKRFFVTELQRKVGEPPLSRVRIALMGIPGPGPWRWIAAALALVVLVAGAVLARRRAPDRAARTASADARRREILARAVELEALRRAGEIGPEHHAEQSAMLVDALAAVLAEEESARPPASPSRA